jgi:hypothetical protein
MTAEPFPPTLREVMLRPWWLGMLVFALVVAAVFAWLGQWQLGRAIDTSPPAPGATEQVRPIADVTAPGAYLPEPLVGQRVEVAGSFVPAISSWSPRASTTVSRGTGSPGSCAPTRRPHLLAVAVGWSADRAVADAAASTLNADPGGALTLTGGSSPTRARRAPTRGRGHRDDADVAGRAAELVARHRRAGGVPFLPRRRRRRTPRRRARRDRLARTAEGSSVNWLNIFYAVEWAIFAGFAFYMWYRLARDAWEKEVEALEEAQAAGAAAHAD